MVGLSASLQAQPLTGTVWEVTGSLRTALSAQGIDSMKMEFLAGGQFRLRYQWSGRDTTSEGLWWQVDANNYKMVDTSGAGIAQVCDPGDTALTTYTIQADTLEMTSIQDDCILRSSLYTMSKWVNRTVGVGTGAIPANREVLVYPNPAGETVYIRAGNLFEKGETLEIALFDLMGRRVKESRVRWQAEVQLDGLADLPAGNYLVQLRYGNGQFTTQRLLICH